MAGRPLRDEDLAFLSGQLAALTAREAPLSGGLRAMAADAPEGPLRAAVARLADDVERGVSLSKAVQAQPTAFPELLAAAVEAGEASNSLPDVLSSFSRHCRMFASLRVRAWHAAIYPAVLLFVGVMVILFAETLVMPYMREMLREMNVEVPFFCQAALWLSGHVAHFIVFALFVLAVTTAGLRVLRRSLAGRRAYERLVLELPWVGAVTRNSLHARFCRGLALLLKAGAPLPRALRLAIHSGGSAVLAGPGQAMVSQVESGVPLSAAMAGQKFFPDEMVRTVQVAEKRGDLPEAVLDLADMYEQETEYAARVLRGVLPGLALVVVLPMMGLVVLSVLSPFLSLFRVMQSIGSGGGPQGGSPTAMGITIAIWLIPILVLIRMALSWAGGHPHQRARGFVTRHLAFVTRRNLPLGPALQTLAQAGPVAFRWQLKKLFSHVEAGQPLACAMSRFPRLFPPAYVSMVRAGETNGNLAAVFQKLQTYDEAVIRFQRRLALTIMYPLTVFGILVVILTLMTVYVSPRFERLLAKADVEAPASTRALFQIVPHVKDVSLALGLIALVVIGLASLRHRARWARRTLQVPLAAFPGYARCVRDIAVARFCHTLSALLDAGTPMVGALEAAASVRTGVRIEKHLARLSQGVAEGRSLSAQMAASGGFPSTFQWMVSVGEQSGDLPRALARLADMYEASAGRMLTYMTRALFPMLIVALGVAEAVFVFAMFLPLVKLAGGIGPG